MNETVSLSDGDRADIEHIQALAREGAVEALIDRLRTRRWPVRRAAVAALAELGDRATDALCRALSGRRDDEGQIAALVDALTASRGDVRKQVEALASHEVPAVVCDAAAILGRRRTEASVPLLASLTLHSDDNVAIAAVEALGRIGSGEAVDALLRLAESGSFFRVFPTIDVLGRSGDPRATAVLSRLLGDPLYAPEAARALGRSGDVAAIDALLSLILRSTDAVVRVAAVALVEIHDRLYGRFGSAAAGLKQTGVPVVRLREALTAADTTEEVALVRLLGLLGNEESIAALIELVTRGNGRAVSVAESVLRDLGVAALEPLAEAIQYADSESRAILLPLIGARAPSPEPIARCLSDASARVRALAADTLARMGATNVLPRLFDALRDRDPRVVQAAVGAIQSLGSAESEARAIAAATDSDPNVRRAGVRILAYFGYPGALEPLLAAVSDVDERVREVALGGLPLLGDPRAAAAIRAALSSESPRTRAAAVRALGQLEARADVFEPLSSALTDGDAWVRYYACQALARTRDERAVPALIAALSDDAGQVRVGAIEALAHFHDPRAVGALTEAAEGGDPDMRRSAIIGFGLSGSATAFPIIARALRDPDAATRLVAVSALALISGSEVLETIAGATADADPSVASAAINVLGERPEAEAFEALLPLLDDPATAERALFALASPVTGRVQAITTALAQAAPERASMLAAALVRMKTPESQAALIGALSSPAMRTRRAIAAALSVVPLPEHRSATQRALDAEHDPDVRALLRKALSA